MAMATRDVEKENAVQNEASPRVAGPVSGGSGGRKRTTVGSSCREAKRQRAVSATALLEQPCREGILPPGEPTGQQQAAPGADPAPAPTAVAAAAEPLSAASPAQDDRLVHAKAKGCAAASPGPAACAATDEEPKGADGSGGGSAQPEGVSMEGLPSWCDRPLVTREHFPEDAVVDAFCLLPGHPLLALAAEGQAPLLGKVLENGGDPDARDSRGYTALHLACWHARLACVRVLLEAGASLQVVDAAGRTAGELAQAAGHADVADMLRQHEEVQRALREQRLKQLEHSQEQAEMVDAAC